LVKNFLCQHPAGGLDSSRAIFALCLVDATVKGVPAPGGASHTTKAARILKNTRDALIRHCGGSPSITQLQIIERCCWLTLKLSMLDGKIVAGKESAFDNDQYLAWQGHLTRNLLKLGLQPAAAKTPTLADVLGESDAA